jgi:hypothetical protein
MSEKIPDVEQRHQAAEARIFTLAERLSQGPAAGEKLIADVESRSSNRRVS